MEWSECTATFSKRRKIDALARAPALTQPGSTAVSPNAAAKRAGVSLYLSLAAEEARANPIPLPTVVD